MEGQFLSNDYDDAALADALLGISRDTLKQTGQVKYDEIAAAVYPSKSGTNYVDIYLKCVGVSFIPLVFVNVYRNGIQGMGYGLLPMTAGIAELIGRSSAALIASYVGSYAGICMASPVAWVLAGGLLLLMYRWIMKSRNLL